MRRKGTRKPASPPRLRIAQAIASRAWGGRERTPLLLAKGLRDRGHEVTVWADPASPAAEEARRLGLPLFPFRWKGHLHPGGILQILSDLKAADPHLLHLHLSKDLWMTVPALYGSRWRNPLFLTKHVGSYIKKSDPLHAWLYRRVDRVFTCSDVIRRNVIETTTVPAERVEVSYAPVDMERFQFSGEQRRKTRLPWRVREGQPVVGMVARLSPGKGHEILMQAAALLHADMPDVRFRMAGDTSPNEVSYKEELLNLRDRLGLREVFEYVGYVPDVPGFLSATDLVVHTARAEAFGLAAVEALACGRPVVGRAGEGLDEILGDGKGCVRVRSDDPAEWAAAIGGLLRNKPHYLRLAYQARKSAARFSLETLALWHEVRYIEALRQKGILT